jgi:hypothetical protein
VEQRALISGPVFRPVDLAAAYLDTSPETQNGTQIFGRAPSAQDCAWRGPPTPLRRAVVRILRRNFRGALKSLPKISSKAIIRSARARPTGRKTGSHLPVALVSQVARKVCAMMSAFDELWWDLDQIVAWAETREREAVECAELGRGGVRPPPTNEKIALRISEAAAFAARNGRDINAELWAASGLPFERQAPPMPVRSFAEAHFLELKLPVTDLPEAKALVEAFATAEDHERFLVYSLFNSQFESERNIPSHPNMANLSPELRGRLRAYCALALPSANTWDQPLRKFQTATYVLRLLREGRLKARGFLPGEALARELTAADWTMLKIEVGGIHKRLFVWRTFPPANDRNGDIEEVRIGRTEILIEFPPNAPAKQATDDDARCLLLEAIDKNGGYITQKNGAEIVRSRFPGFKKERAMQLVKELTQNMKRGPRGSRQ